MTKTARSLAAAALLAAVCATDARAQNIEIFDRGGWGPTIVRFGQDYTLKRGDAVGDVVVVYSPATIEGIVRGNVVVAFGTARISKTAVIDGNLFVGGGNVTIESGAIVRHDLLVFGGVVDAPSDFRPGHEHIIVGAPGLADRIRGIVPWVTEGLLLGRPIVPRLDWVWFVVGVIFFISLLLCLIFLNTARTCADAIAARPLSTFLVGLLVLLLIGPVAVVLAASVIGLAVLPFLFCGLVIAWIIGKIGVKLRIGDSIVGHTGPASQMQNIRSFVIGFAVITLAYMLPVLGFIVWALIGVTGLGAASLAFMSAYRRENPKNKVAATPPPPLPPPIPVPVAPEPIFSESIVPEAAPIPAAAAAAPALAAPSVAASPATLLGFPRGGFIERAVAFVIDVALILILLNLLNGGRRYDDDIFIPLLLAYHVGFWTWKGTTVGGIILQLRLVRVDGERLRFIDTLVRGLSGIFSIVALGIGYLWMLRDSQHQTWHDKIAGTYVVKVPRNWPV